METTVGMKGMKMLKPIILSIKKEPVDVMNTPLIIQMDTTQAV